MGRHRKSVDRHYRGRHRAPTETGRYVARATTAGVVALTPLSVAATPAHASEDLTDQLVGLLRCESGGDPARGRINWTAKNPSSSASGAFQIIDGTWRAYGGLEFAATARQATPQQQTIVAVRIAQRGGVSQWECARRAGFTDPDAISWDAILRLTGEVRAATPAPAPVPVTPAPRTEVAPETAPPPVQPPPSNVEASESRHRVRSGDTLSGISLSHLGSPDYGRLYAANRTTVGENPHWIFPGQVLVIPDGTPVVTSAATSAPIVASTPAPVVEGSSDRTSLVDGRVSSGFGMRSGRMHNGMDIAAPIGTPIRAPRAGVVINAGPASGFGLWVRIRHDDGTVTTYGHVDSYSVRVGARVAEGEVIAKVGNRGQSTGPHLHFEVTTPGGKRIDPRGWLDEMGVSIR